MKRQKLYSYKAIDQLLENLAGKGYELIQLNEGCLGSGDWFCIAPNDDHYHFIIKEIALNEWTSAHTIRRCSKISKAMMEKINNIYN